MFWDNLKHWNLKKNLLLKHVLLEISAGGILSGGILSGGILERGDFVRGDFVLGGYCPGGYCPGDIVRGDIVLEPLGGLLGSSGRVFSRCHKSKRHEISPLRLRRGNFRISGPTFRALDRPQDVHSPGKGNRCLPEDVWYKHLPVPRRLARRRRDPPVSSQLQGHGPHDNSESGLPHQRGKVRLDADPVPNVPGLGSRSCPDDGVSVRGPNRSSETPDPTDHEVPGKPGETMEVSLRPLGQHDSAGPEGSTPHPSAPVFHTGALGSLNAGLTPGDSL